MNAIIIIGAGDAGTRAAFAPREAGFSGPLTLIGSEAHLPYERPPLSKLLNGVVQMKTICSHSRPRGSPISRAGMSVTRIDAARRHLLLGDGRMLDYDRLLLATAEACTAGFQQTRRLPISAASRQLRATSHCRHRRPAPRRKVDI